MGGLDLFLENSFLPLVKRARFLTLFSWIVNLVLGLFVGTQILSAFRPDLNMPPGTYSETAYNNFVHDFPGVLGGQPPILIVGQIVNPAYTAVNLTYDVTVALMTELADFGPTATLGVAPQVSAIDPTIALFTITPNVSYEDAQPMTTRLVKWAKTQTVFPQYKLQGTGLFAMAQEGSSKIEGEVFTIFPVVLVLSFLFSGLYLRSWRLLLFVMLNFVITLFFAMLLFYSAVVAWVVVPNTSLILLFFALVVSLQYSIGMFSRFQEEMRSGNNLDGALLAAYKYMGRVVTISGFTLAVSFFVSLCFDDRTLRSMNLCAALVLMSGFLTHISFAGAFFYSFPKFWTKEYAESNEKVKAIASFGSQCWVQISSVVTNPLYAFIIVISILVFTIPLLVQMQDQLFTSDLVVVYDHQGTAYTSYDLVSKYFSPGTIFPYYVLSRTQVPNGLATEKFYAAQGQLVLEIMRAGQAGGYANGPSMLALSNIGGFPVSYSLAQTFMNASDPTLAFYPPILIGTYQYFYFHPAGRNIDNSASFALITPTKFPIGQSFEEHMLEIKSICQAYTEVYNSPVSMGGIDPELKIEFWLLGGMTSDYDQRHRIFPLFSGNVGIVMGIILFALSCYFWFQTAIRTVLCIGIIYTTTFGLMRLVYQHGASQTNFSHGNDDLNTSPGVYWFVPISAFTFLVDIILDYDTMFVTRYNAYLCEGWSDKASIRLALCKTGPTYFFLGSIMSIIFGAFLGSKVLFLNQFGFSVWMGVLLEIFLIQTLFVPSVLTLISYYYTIDPKRVEKRKYEERDEEKALLAHLAGQRGATTFASDQSVRSEGKLLSTSNRDLELEVMSPTSGTRPESVDGSRTHKTKTGSRKNSIDDQMDVQ